MRLIEVDLSPPHLHHSLRWDFLPPSKVGTYDLICSQVSSVVCLGVIRLYDNQVCRSRELTQAKIINEINR
jgi:hypothetical protein